MGFLNLQSRGGDLGFTSSSYLKTRRFKSKSIVTFIAILLFHLVLIVVVFNAKLKQRETSAVPAFKMIYLSQEKPPDQTELHIPVVERVLINASVVVPEIIIDEQSAQAIQLDLPQSNYQLPNPNDAKYRDVFDPKMRQKLIAAEPFNRELQSNSLKSWRTSGGQMVDEIGDGLCMTALPKTDSRDRGTAYTTFKCGPSDSEKMMDSVMADFESRKHPLKTQ